MEVSRERGFYPRAFTVKKGVPVELTVDNQVGNLGGCMSVMTIPRYNVAKQLLPGKTKFAFTPTETGTVPLTCSMGIEMARVTVTE
jgi:plastocyanin domain-containing protein